MESLSVTGARKASSLKLGVSEWLGPSSISPTTVFAEVFAEQARETNPNVVNVRGNFSVGLDLEALPADRVRHYDTLILHVACFELADRENTGFWLRASARPDEEKPKFFEQFMRGHAYLFPIGDLDGGNRVAFEFDRDTGAVGKEAWKDGPPEFTVQISLASRKRIEAAVAEATVFVFSTARSGSTWLASDILGWQHRTRIVDEPGLGQFIAPLQWDAERFAKPGSVSRYVPSGEAYETGTASRNLPEGVLPLFERQNAKLIRPGQIFNPAYAHNIVLAVRRVLLYHFIEVWGLMGFQRYVVKMPNESHAADLILQALPEARAIHLIRDGRDVLRSRFGAFASGILSTTQNSALRRYAVAYYAHFWNFQNDIIEQACDAHERSRTLRIRYEDLHRDRIVQARRIFEWMGLDLPESEEMEFSRAIDIANAPPEETGFGRRRGEGVVGGFKTTFTPGEIRLMEQIMGPVLERHGYPLLLPAGDRAPDDPESADFEGFSASLQRLGEQLADARRKLGEAKVANQNI